MLENFASIEEKIQHLNSPIFILDGVYTVIYEDIIYCSQDKIRFG